jgi:ubiquinol-cytochrome c reductase cytochrome b subunit
MLLLPFSLGEPELVVEANPALSPVHIVPEWYLLFAYSILRSVNSKPLGVILVAVTLGLLYLLALNSSTQVKLRRLARVVGLVGFVLFVLLR